jgi:hypothetical protein
MKIILGPACDCDTCATASRNFVGYQVRINGARDVHVRSIDPDGMMVGDAVSNEDDPADERSG